MAKPCPVSKKDFLESAKAVKVTINGQDFWMEPREFNSGSFGWQLTGKSSVELAGGKVLHLQVGLNATVIGSKDAPADTK